MEKNNEDVLVQSRISISVAILAIVVALYGFNTNSTDLWSATRGFMLFPGIFSLFYLIFEGSNLKYKNQTWIGHIKIPEKIKQITYDTMINVFWVGSFFSISFFIAMLFGWDGVALNGKYYYGFWSAVIISLILVIIGACSERPKRLNKTLNHK